MKAILKTKILAVFQTDWQPDLDSTDLTAQLRRAAETPWRGEGEWKGRDPSCILSLKSSLHNTEPSALSL